MSTIVPDQPAATPRVHPTVMRLRGPLDADCVFALMAQLERKAAGDRILLECSRVTAMDPVGVNALWRMCRNESLAGRRILVSDLPQQFSRRLRRHPVAEYLAISDELFQDPFGTTQPSER